MIIKKIFYSAIFLTYYFFAIVAVPAFKDITIYEWADYSFQEIKEVSGSSLAGSDFKINFSTLQSEFGNKCNEQNLPSNQYVQKIVIPEQSTIVLIGDVEGSYHSLMRSFLRMIKLGYLNSNWELPKNTYVVFLGDLISGSHDAEVLFSVLKLKLINFDQVFCIKGNMDGAYSNVFNRFPHVLLINSNNNWIHCSHGGFKKGYNFGSFLNSNDVFRGLSDWKNFQECGFVGKKNIEAERHGSTQASYAQKTVIEYCRLNNLKVLFRGHQDSKVGLKMFFNKEEDTLEEAAKEIILREKTSISSKYLDICFYHWQTVARYYKSISKPISTGLGIVLNECKYPVFTLSTMTNRKSDFDCFCVLKTEKDYKDWILKPYEYCLPTNRKGNFVSIKSDGSSETESYNDHDNTIPVLEIKGLDDPIIVKWVNDKNDAGIKISSLTLSLDSLKNKLKDLKFKLEALSSRLGVLQKSLNP